MKLAAAILFALSLSAFAAEKPSAPVTRSAQPATESLDLDTIARIRDEGFNHSHIMEYASGLFDGIGPRLTGSPDFEKAAQWSVDQLRRMGAANPHTESWGDFGMGWQQIGTSIQMTAPSTATILGQATPWSPATTGEITGQIIAIPTLEDEKAFDKWKGKLAGKIVLYGSAPRIDPNPSAPIEHLDAAKLAHLYDYPLNGDQDETDVLSKDPAYWSKVFGRMAFKEKIGHFFADEHAAAILVENGSASTFHDDTGSSLGWFVYQPQHKQAIPSAVISADAFGRISRLAAHDVPVDLRLNIATRFTGDHVDGENVIADIPGTDPALKNQVVLMGGHLDSWIAGTGATDNGAGTIIALEAMRILRALDVHPRRTIRIGLWGGEEQGIFGSLGYVNSHLATTKYSDKPEFKDVPIFLQAPVSITTKPDHAAFDAYFNADNGTGKFLGIFAEGNSAVATVFDQWAAPIRDLGFTTISMRSTGSTDHVNFDQVGLPGFQFIQDPRDYESRTHHTNLDTYERLSEPDLRQAAVIMAIFVYNTAQRDALLPRKPMPNPAFEEKQAKPLEGIYPTATKQ